MLHNVTNYTPYCHLPRLDCAITMRNPAIGHGLLKRSFLHDRRSHQMRISVEYRMQRSTYVLDKWAECHAPAALRWQQATTCRVARETMTSKSSGWSCLVGRRAVSCLCLKCNVGLIKAAHELHKPGTQVLCLGVMHRGECTGVTKHGGCTGVTKHGGCIGACKAWYASGLCGEGGMFNKTDQMCWSETESNNEQAGYDNQRESTQYATSWWQRQLLQCTGSLRKASGSVLGSDTTAMAEQTHVNSFVSGNAQNMIGRSKSV